MMENQACIDIKNATKEKLLEEYEYCMGLWGKYSCDCFGFYISAIQNKITELGGFPPR